MMKRASWYDAGFMSVHCSADKPSQREKIRVVVASVLQPTYAQGVEENMKDLALARQVIGRFSPRIGFELIQLNQPNQLNQPSQLNQPRFSGIPVLQFRGRSHRRPPSQSHILKFHAKYTDEYNYHVSSRLWPTLAQKMSRDAINRWIQEVEGAKRHQKFQLNEMVPKKKEGATQRITRSQTKRYGDDLLMNAPPSKKILLPTATATSKQPTSTADHISELESAGITFMPLNPELLPPDSHSLYTSTSEISDGFKTIPITVRAVLSGRRLLPAKGGTRKAGIIREKAHVSTTLDPVHDSQILGDYHLSSETALRELDLLRDVVDEALRCEYEMAHEADWNCTIRARNMYVSVNNSATIVPEYVPCNLQTGEPLQSQNVDFCLALEPEEAMRLFVDRQDLRTINQTVYNPLKKRLIAVSIETKSLAKHTTGMSQLAIWTYAWFARVTQLAPNAHIPTLPLLRIDGHEWHIMWAWKHSEDPLRMTLTSERSFGHTRNLLGVYRILAMLRRLAKWAEEVFQPPSLQKLPLWTRTSF
ncbi:hypothetical protein ACRALDRAFT_207957 [Sodiomyces alcalophilus JCM 7366]|uniref:uncharacterized protein n=1 Tax=Sodiomyces alcalophilus JCM 7366 TaxID=591952 RepID=UPI0039B410B6